MLSEIVYIVGALLAGGVIGWLLAKQKTNHELSQAKSELSRAEALNEAKEGEDDKTRNLLNLDHTSCLRPQKNLSNT